MEELINHKQPLRILMTTDTLGGVWSYSLQLCKALLPFNVHFYLVTTGAPLQPAQKIDVECLRNVEVYETDFQMEWMDNPWESISTCAKCLLQLEEKLQPHLVHLNEYAYGSLPWKAPVIVVAHSDVFSWWLAVKGTNAPAEWDLYYRKVKEGLEGADFLLAPSKWMIDEVRKIYEVKVPGKVIYNGRCSTDFYSAPKSQSLLSIGRLWDEGKNIKLLIRAAPQINYFLHLAGASSFGDSSCTGKGTNIGYLGKLPQNEVAKQLSITAVYVLPAKYEPFGLSVLEAALSGCALVLGNIASLREIWEDNAVYVDTSDENEIAKTINDLLVDKVLLRKYAEAAEKHAAKYTVSAMAESYLQVYGELHRKNIL